MTPAQEYAALTDRIARANETGLCVSCHTRPRAAYADGSLSMTCLDYRCLRSWLPVPKEMRVVLHDEEEE